MVSVPAYKLEVLDQILGKGDFMPCPKPKFINKFKELMLSQFLHYCSQTKVCSKPFNQQCLNIKSI